MTKLNNISSTDLKDLLDYLVSLNKSKHYDDAILIACSINISTFIPNITISDQLDLYNAYKNNENYNELDNFISKHRDYDFDETGTTISNYANITNDSIDGLINNMKDIIKLIENKNRKRTI